MADTIFTDIVTSSWTEISVGTLGFITNDSGHDILYIESAIAPVNGINKGHHLHPQDSISYNLQTGQKVFARSLNSDSQVAITQGSFSVGGNPAAKNLLLEISRNKIPGQSRITVSGFNPDVDAIASETIWDQGGDKKDILINTELFISSSNVSDINIGLFIEGITDDFVEKDMLITFTGGQTQQSIGDFMEIFTVRVLSGSAPLGDLYFAESTAAPGGVPTDVTKIQSKIIQGVNTTRNGFFTVPLNHTMLVYRTSQSARKNEDAVMLPLLKPPGAPGYIEITQFPVFQSFGQQLFDPPFPIAEKTRIRLDAITDTNNTEVTATLSTVLVDNNIA